MTNVRNERVAITTDPMVTEREIKGYYTELYGYKSDNLDEMKQFLQRYILPKFTHTHKNRKSK